MEKPKLNEITLAITGLQDFMWQIRREAAKGLRRVASEEEPRVSKRLHEIAAALEVGAVAGEPTCQG